MPPPSTTQSSALAPESISKELTEGEQIDGHVVIVDLHHRK